jgi:hypothetical protein
MPLELPGLHELLDQEESLRQLEVCDKYLLYGKTWDFEINTSEEKFSET